MLRPPPIHLDVRRHEIASEFVFRGERVVSAASQAQVGHRRRSTARVRIDVIELETARVKEVYRVERTWVVDPADVSVLDPTPTRALTLVTCYPFYYIGPAPRRFIVRAVLVRPTNVL